MKIADGIFMLEISANAMGNPSAISPTLICHDDPLSNNYDMDLYAESMKKLMQYDIESVICYHGGFFRADVNKRIAELARDL